MLFVLHRWWLQAVASLAKGGGPGGRHSATTMAISCLQDRDRDIRCEALDAWQRRKFGGRWQRHDVSWEIASGNDCYIAIENGICSEISEFNH